MTAAKTTPAMFRCGACGGLTPVELAMESHAASRVVTRCMQSLGDVGPALLGYMALHRPAKRVLTWDKVERLLDELLGWYDAAAITRDHITVPLTDAVWLDAIGAVKDAAGKTLTLPLDGNAYLAAILASRAKLALDAERQTREALARGETPVGYSAAHAPAHVAVATAITTSGAAGAVSAELPRAEIPPHVAATLGQFTRRAKLHRNGTTVDDDTSEPPEAGANLKGRSARIERGALKGKAGEIIRHEGDTVWLRINQPRIGERVVSCDVSEVAL